MTLKKKHKLLKLMSLLTVLVTPTILISCNKDSGKKTEDDKKTLDKKDSTEQKDPDEKDTKKEDNDNSDQDNSNKPSNNNDNLDNQDEDNYFKPNDENTTENEYEILKNKFYPNDIDYDKKPETNERRNADGLDWSKVQNYENNSVFFNETNQKKIILSKRSSKIGDDLEEIKELKELLNKLVSSNEYYAFEVSKLNFNARNMTKALLEWYRESWPDYLYVEFSLKSIYFETETADGNQDLTNINSKTYQDQFIRLKTIEKFPSTIKLDWINEGIDKENLLHFIKNGLAQISNDMSDLDKVYAIVRYVCDYFVYDDLLAFSDLQASINTRKAVCQQYGTSIALLLQLSGVHAIPKQSGDMEHQYALVYFDPAGQNNKKWHRVDGTHADDGRESAEKNKDIFIHKDTRKYTNTFVNPIIGNASSIETGYDLIRYLPWDFMFKNNEYSKVSNYDESFLPITSNTKWGEKFSRYFYSNGYWYMITNRRLDSNYNNVNFLYKVKSNSNKLQIVKAGNKILDDQDKIAPLIELNSVFHRTYDHNGILYLFYKNSNGEMVLDLIDIKDNKTIETKIKLKDIINTNEFDSIITISNIRFDMLKDVIYFDAEGIKDENYLKLPVNIDFKNSSNKKLQFFEKTNKNLVDLWRYKTFLRAKLGTYMFSKSEKMYSLKTSLRNKFKELEKEIDLAFNHIDSDNVDVYIQKLKDIEKQIEKNWWVKTLKNNLKIDQQIASTIFIDQSHYDEYGFHIPFKTVYDFNIHNTSDNHIMYDVYYSDKPFDKDNTNKANLLLKSVLKKELKLDKSILNTSGYILIKSYYRGNEDKSFIFSNLSKIDFYTSNKFSIFFEKPNNKLFNNHNLNLSLENTNFEENYYISFSFLLKNYSLIKNKIHYRILHKDKNASTIVDKGLFDPQEYHKIQFLVDKNKYKNGSYLFELDIEFENKIYTYYSEHFLDISKKDVNDFDINKYF